MGHRWIGRYSQWLPFCSLPGSPITVRDSFVLGTLDLFGHGDRDNLAAGTLGDPEGITSRFHSSWCFEPFLEYGHAGLVSVDGDGGDFAAAVFGDDEVAIGGAHAVRPLDQLVHPDIFRLPRLSGGVDWDAVELVEDDVVHIERAAEKGDAIDARKGPMLEEQFGGRGAGRQPVDFAVGGVGYIKGLIGSDRKIIARAVVSGQIPTDLLRAGGQVEASEGSVPAHWTGVRHRG